MTDSSSYDSLAIEAGENVQARFETVKAFEKALEELEISAPENISLKENRLKKQKSGQRKKLIKNGIIVSTLSLIVLAFAAFLFFKTPDSSKSGQTPEKAVKLSGVNSTGKTPHLKIEQEKTETMHELHKQKLTWETPVSFPQYEIEVKDGQKSLPLSCIGAENRIKADGGRVCIIKKPEVVFAGDFLQTLKKGKSYRVIITAIDKSGLPKKKFSKTIRGMH
jgi:hypothetical protein